jgi:beta-lactamase class A
MDTTNSPYFKGMKTFLSIIVVILSFLSELSAQKKLQKLESTLKEISRDFKGQIGIHVVDLTTGKTVSLNADTVFPTASMVKLPILLGVMDKINSGALKDSQNLIYSDSLLYEGVDILGSFKNGEKIELGKLVMLMLTMSDNTASLWLQSLAGTGIAINELLEKNGFTHTRVNSRTPGREKNREQFGWGQTTPREMVMFVQKMYNHEFINDAVSERMLKMTSRNFWDDVALSQIPSGIFVSSKNGAVDASRSEVLLVYGPNPYAFYIATKNNEDTSWTSENEAWVLTRKISRILWEYFNTGKTKR